MSKSLIYHLKYGYTPERYYHIGIFGLMLERCTIPRLTRDNLLWSLSIQSLFHRMDVGDKKKIIDYDNVFPSTIESSWL
jgi:hypothetical protein